MTQSQGKGVAYWRFNCSFLYIRCRERKKCFKNYLICTCHLMSWNRLSKKEVRIYSWNIEYIFKSESHSFPGKMLDPCENEKTACYTDVKSTWPAWLYIFILVLKNPWKPWNFKFIPGKLRKWAGYRIILKLETLETCQLLREIVLYISNAPGKPLEKGWKKSWKPWIF
jgi:hypothetical protein